MNIPRMDLESDQYSIPRFRNANAHYVTSDTVENIFQESSHIRLGKEKLSNLLEQKHLSPISHTPSGIVILLIEQY